MNTSKDNRDGATNTVSGDISGSTVIQGQNIRVAHHAAHEVNWPIRIGAIPEEAAHFQHRAIADQLEEVLNNSGTVVLRQVLSGTGGVGKTQLAAHHARTLTRSTDPDKRVDLLIWANASTRDQITFAYAQAAQLLFATVPDDPEHAASLFLTWLQDPHKHRDRRWLIVWDDLADPSQVSNLWPPHDQPHGRVLVTTRRRDSSLTTQGRHLIDVDVYTPEEAHAFLTRAADDAGVPHTLTDLESLARDLGYLPLALGQAITYMAELGMGCKNYLQVFHDRMRTLAEVFPDWDTPTPLAATWDLSLEQADAFIPKGIARPMMGLIALLDGTGIPQQVLTAPPILEYLAAHRIHEKDTPPTAAQPSLHPSRAHRLIAGLTRVLGLAPAASRNAPATPELTTDEALRALANLERLNLMACTALHRDREQAEFGGILVGAHQLVQRATREHTATRPTWHSVRALADALLQVWPEIERDASLAERLRRNTIVLGSHRTAEEHSSQDWLWEPDGHMVLFRAGRSLDECGLAQDAVSYWEIMVDHARNYLGPNHLGVFAARNNHAKALGQTGAFMKAATVYEQLLKDETRALGPDHPNTLRDRGNLTLMLIEAGKSVSGTDSYENVLQGLERVLGPDNLNVLIIRNNLAHSRGEDGDTAGAIQDFRLLIRDQERILGPEHPETLKSRHNLAERVHQIGDIGSAKGDIKEILADQVRILGPDHESTFRTRQTIAEWKGIEGDTQGAVSDYERILSDRLRTLGPDHIQTLNARHNMAVWRTQAGGSDLALVELEALLEDEIRVLGSDHLNTFTTRTIISTLHFENGNIVEAIKILDSLFRDQKKLFGPNHPDTVLSARALKMFRAGYDGGSQSWEG